MANKASGEYNDELEMAQLPIVGEASDPEYETDSSKNHGPADGTLSSGRNSPKSKKNNRKMQRKGRRIDREMLVNAKDNMTLVATLIATFTYSAGLNPPGGVYQDGPLIGTAVAARITAFRVFSVFNNLALFLALTVVFILVSSIPTKRKSLLRKLGMSYRFVWAAICFLAAEYVAAVAVVMKPAPSRRGLDWTTVLLLCVSGCTLGTATIAVGFRTLEFMVRKPIKQWRGRAAATAS